MELFNCLGVGVVWCCDESEVVLILLELGGHISGDITVRFKGKVLCLECRTEVVAADFTFSTVVLCITDVITAEVVQSLAMTKVEGR